LRAEAHLGFARSIVEYSSQEEAQRAIKELSDTPLLGRPVFVREVSRSSQVESRRMC
jgi:RNA recognition motif-containing protein